MIVIAGDQKRLCIGLRLKAYGLSSVPRNIKEEIKFLVYNLDRSKGSDDLATPPGLWLNADVL